jgi:hypothetical protein
MSALSTDGVIVARMLGLSNVDDSTVINVIEDCVDVATSRLLVRIGAEVVPEQLGYIVREVAIKRYNRIGSEGVSSHTVEGESQSWNEDDLEPFEADINAYLASIHNGKAKIKFL